MKTEPYIGIDFGTTNCSVAWFNPETGLAEILRNAEGENETPSVVHFGELETVVGSLAEHSPDSSSREQGRCVISGVKTQIAAERSWAVGGKHVGPVDVAAEIFKKLLRDAENFHFKEPVTRAVVGCPATFDRVERDKVEEAARRAGLREVALLEEPAAAARAYAAAGFVLGSHLLVYDLGGRTFDLAVLVREPGEEAYHVAVEPTGLRVGGDDFDRALYEYVDDKLLRQFGQRICQDGIDLRFLRACRRKKIELSTREELPFRFPFRGRGRATVILKRKTFEQRIENLVEQTIGLARTMADDARRAGFPVDTVIPVGGSSRVPLIRRRLHEALGIEPLDWQKRHVAVALGAAHFGHSLWGIPAALPWWIDYGA